VHALLVAAPASTDALARLLGVEAAWAAEAAAPAVAAASPAEEAARDLLTKHPACASALAGMLFN
jgi:hypothetical protein